MVGMRRTFVLCLAKRSGPTEMLVHKADHTRPSRYR